jgi:hypothetical protein
MMSGSFAGDPNKLKVFTSEGEKRTYPEPAKEVPVQPQGQDLKDAKPKQTRPSSKPGWSGMGEESPK